MSRKHVRVYDDGTHLYSVAKLWALTASLPTVYVNIGDLEHELGGKWWDDSNGVLITPRAVLDAMLSGSVPPEYAEHAWAVRQADLRFPILVTTERDGSFSIVDGKHRLLHAILAGRAIIVARVVPRELMLEAVLEEQAPDKK